MDGLRVGDVVRPLAPLSTEDTLARAAEVLRSVPFDRVPVVEGGRLVGAFAEHTLGDAMRALFQGAASTDDLRLMTLGEPLLTPITPLRVEDRLDQVGARLQDGVRSLPAVDGDGRYVGMVDAADVTSSLLHAHRPPSIGGMATPLGVYLTTGTLSAGARGSLGLLLSGASIGLVYVLSSVVAAAAVGFAGRQAGIPIGATFHSEPVGWWHANPYDIWPHLLVLVGLVVFAVLFRLSPLTGYHAAEHQVVHAIEQDRPLTPESVARMPRAHPRCGSRFTGAGVLIALFLLVLPVSSAAGAGPISYTGGAAVVAVLLWWRRLGTHLQNYVTTKPASLRQLRSAIAAAEELLAKYRRSEPRRPTLAQRLWYMGLPQVAVGMYSTVFAASYYLERHLPLLVFFR